MSEKLMDLCDKTSLWEDFHPKDIGWMDDVEPLDEFFLWLKNCVTNQNCITPEELKTHKVLLEFGRFEDEEEKFVTKNYPLESIDVYPHSNDLELLETLCRQNQMRLVNHEDFFKLIRTEEKTVNHYKLGFKVDQMLDTEFRKVNSLIAGEYRRSALALAAKCSQLNENLENISESVNSDLVCLTPMSTFCDLMEYLHLYITSSIEAFQGGFKQLSLPMDGSSSGNLNSSRNLDNNLRRAFDDCVHLKASCVEIQSQMEGITEICNALDISDLFAVIPSSDQTDAATSEDLFMVCYDSVTAAFLNYEVKYKTDKQIKRRKILASLEKLRRIARPLKLCGDSVCLMIKDEFKWIRVTRAILSDVWRGLEEIQQQIEQSCKQLVNIRAVHELSSSASHTYPEIPSNSLKLFESRCDISAISHNDGQASSVGSNLLSDCLDKKIVENVISRMHAGRLDSAFRMIKYFSEDVVNSLSYAKTVYCRIFNGPSATMYLESDLISSIVRIDRELKTKKDELEKLDCRRFEIEMMFGKGEELLGALALMKFCFVSSLGGFLVSIQHKVTDGEVVVNHWVHACSGVLLTANQVLTCSSCLMFDNDGSFEIMVQNLRVYSGNEDPDVAEKDPNGQILSVSSVENHPDYKPAPVVEPVYDFGVLKTDKPFVLGSRLHVTQLYSTDAMVVKQHLETVGRKCQTMTWDFYFDGERQRSPLKGVWIDVVFHGISRCGLVRNDGTARMNQTFTMEEDEDDFLMCAVSPQSHPICGMDPGSPIICEGKVIAVVSNIGLLCERGLQNVVITGINNAMAFITEPFFLHHPKLKTLEHLRIPSPNDASTLTRMVTLITLVELIKCILLDL